MLTAIFLQLKARSFLPTFFLEQIFARENILVAPRLRTSGLNVLTTRNVEDCNLLAFQWWEVAVLKVQTSAGGKRIARRIITGKLIPV